MTEPLGSVNFTALILAVNGPAAIGQALVFDSAQGTWLVATAANRTALGKRAEAIAITAYGGSSVGKIAYRSSGLLANELSLLGTGTASWVRVKSDGYLERCTPAPGDDLVGKCQTDGRLLLTLNTWDYANVSGSGVTLGGSNGDVVIRATASTTTGVTGSNGDVLYKTGGAWTSTPAVQVPAGSSGDVITNDGSGGLANTPTLGASHGGTGLTSPGANGNVLTSNGAGAWTSAAPAGGGAPTSAQYVTLATDGTLTNERVLTAGAAIQLTDGGAGSTITVAVSGLANAQVSGAAAIAYSKLNLSGSIVDGDISGSAAITSTKIALTATQVGFGNGSNQLTGDAGLTYDSANDRLTVTGAIRVATAQNTTGVGVANNTGYYFRNAANSANINALQVDGSDVLRLGDSAVQNVVISYETSAGFYNTDSSVYDFLVNEDSDISCRLPLKGNGGNVKPFQFKRASVACSGTSTTPSSSEYECPILTLTGSLGAEFTLILPDVTGSFYIIQNSTNQSAKPQKSGGSGSPILSSQIKVVIHDGSDYKIVD